MGRSKAQPNDARARRERLSRYRAIRPFIQATSSRLCPGKRCLPGGVVEALVVLGDLLEVAGDQPGVGARAGAGVGGQHHEARVAGADVQHPADRVAGLVGGLGVDVGDGGRELDRVGLEEQLRVPALADGAAADRLASSTVSLMNAICAAVNGVPCAWYSAISSSMAATVASCVKCWTTPSARTSAPAEAQRGDHLAALGWRRRAAARRTRGSVRRARRGTRTRAARVALLGVEDGVVAQLGPRGELACSACAGPRPRCRAISSGAVWSAPVRDSARSGASHWL